MTEFRGEHGPLADRFEAIRDFIAASLAARDSF
jgi:hypothetical protein